MLIFVVKLYEFYGGIGFCMVRIVCDILIIFDGGVLSMSMVIFDIFVCVGINIYLFYSFDIKGVFLVVFVDVYEFEGICGIGELIWYMI